ncbi:hypothetical protein GW17_00038274 [Ensete ventricosum]|nr:hypothetical protein GW17_00038274 [Ensete ventricosum]
MVDFSLNRLSAVDFSLKSAVDNRNRPSTVDFWRNRPVAGGLRTDNLTDRYVLPVPGALVRKLAKLHKWSVAFAALFSQRKSSLTQKRQELKGRLNDRGTKEKIGWVGATA